jgi:hypothetical protein
VLAYPVSTGFGRKLRFFLHIPIVRDLDGPRARRSFFILKFTTESRSECEERNDLASTQISSS